MNSQQLATLLQELTIDEKIGQLIQLSGDFFQEDQAMLVGPQKKLGIKEEMVELVGSVLNITGAETVRRIQDNYLAKSRHKIPLMFMSDIIYGYRTVYPIPLGQAASWNPELIEKGYQKIALESVAGGAHVTYAPMVDLVKDPRWGRCLESTGEDVYLNSRYAEAMVRGFQHDFDEGKGLASCVKHFAAYGAAEGGRDYNHVDMSERRLRQEYLPAYEAAVNAGSKLVMTSFNTVEGVPATGNKWLMNEVLRKEWGFDGVVISDYAAVQELVTHGYAENNKEATYLAMEASNDIDMKTACYSNHLAELIDEGRISMDQLDQAVWRVLTLKNDLGLFEDPYRGVTVEGEEVGVFTLENKAMARKIAGESMVLLKNENQVLPLKPEQKVALIGPYGDSQELMGLWAVHGRMEDVTTIKEAMRSYSQHVDYEQGCDMLEDYGFLGEFGYSQKIISGIELSQEEKEQTKLAAIKLAEEADVIVMALGEHTLQSGEAGSRTNLRIPAKQQELLKELAGLHKPIVLIIISGRPLVLTEEESLVDGLIQGWFPGTEGGNALADILYGKVNPSGRITQSFPVNEGQIPVYYNNYSTGRPENESQHSGRFVSKYLDAPNQPLFPFGYGLSYHETTYSELGVNTKEFSVTKPLEVRVTVTNQSAIEGQEVVQLYIRDLYASVVQPVKSLKGFKKIQLGAYESRELRFEVTEEMLRFYQQDMGLASELGEFEIFVGKNSQACQSIRVRLI
ncbi:beta-glucosidase BglX [uncultured Vagococcus sp.]|uniref:beta-glucosidase BglX n=1 Tax=uncultured Vagococcus sp. TaxID=189676 RepID=UPI0028D121A2|nr:beta-glucosidase BglX [uncultured Vagococcus sp.]